MTEHRRPEAILNYGFASLSLERLNSTSVDDAATLVARARIAAGVGCLACNGLGAVPGYRCDKCGGSGRSDSQWDDPPEVPR